MLLKKKKLWFSIAHLDLTLNTINTMLKTFHSNNNSDTDWLLQLTIIITFMHQTVD